MLGESREGEAILCRLSVLGRGSHCEVAPDLGILHQLLFPLLGGANGQGRIDRGIHGVCFLLNVVKAAF